MFQQKQPPLHLPQQTLSICHSALTTPAKEFKFESNTNRLLPLILEHLCCRFMFAVVTLPPNIHLSFPFPPSFSSPPSCLRVAFSGCSKGTSQSLALSRGNVDPFLKQAAGHLVLRPGVLPHHFDGGRRTKHFSVCLMAWSQAQCSLKMTNNKKMMHSWGKAQSHFSSAPTSPVFTFSSNKTKRRHKH